MKLASQDIELKKKSGVLLIVCLKTNVFTELFDHKFGNLKLIILRSDFIR